MSDIGWFTPGGEPMAEEHWGEGFTRSLGVFLNGKAIPDTDARGRRIVDDSFYLLLNAHQEPLVFRLPPAGLARRWRTVLDTNEPGFEEDGALHDAGAELQEQLRDGGTDACAGTRDDRDTPGEPTGRTSIHALHGTRPAHP